MKKITLFSTLLNFVAMKIFILIGFVKISGSVFEPYQIFYSNNTKFASNDFDLSFHFYIVANILNYFFKFHSEFYFPSIFFFFLALFFYLKDKNISAYISDSQKSILFNTIVAYLLLGFLYVSLTKRLIPLIENHSNNEVLSPIVIIASITVSIYILNLIQAFLSFSLIIYLCDSLKNYFTGGKFSSNIFLQISLKKILISSVIFILLDFFSVYQTINSLAYLLKIEFNQETLLLILRFSVFGKFIYSLILLAFVINWFVKKRHFEAKKLILIFASAFLILFIMDPYKNLLADYGSLFLLLFYPVVLIAGIALMSKLITK